MTDIKHTPGPWVVDVNPWGETSVKSANAEDLQEWPIEYFIAEKIGGHVRGVDFGDFSEVEANADLIAAAPDLLAALENMIGAFDSPIARRKLPSEFNEEAISTARAAIARARGEA